MILFVINIFSVLLLINVGFHTNSYMCNGKANGAPPVKTGLSGFDSHPEIFYAILKISRVEMFLSTGLVCPDWRLFLC
ncbi:hypothetical protein AM500_10840 [Bacillus sp. FJAT-18017]|nr:hypothetical protein AM500_10840 [Bacillus sp. FJAT-18017]